MSPDPGRSIAVALHDIEPATFERCALMRDWLDDFGIAKVTLLVIPARDLHPFSDRSPEMVDWLADRMALGDAVAQLGFQHPRAVTASRRASEFTGLDDGETRRAVAAGRRILRLAGIQPRGFVAPGYAYTAPLRRVLATSFDWWLSLRTLRCDAGRHVTRAPVLTLGAGGTRLASSAALRAAAYASSPVLRLDLRPSDIDQPRRVGAIEAVLRRAQAREALTFDELAERRRPPRSAAPAPR